MIEKIIGKITEIESRHILVNIFGVELKIYANPVDFKPHEESTIFTFMHWHQENGPTLYGFKSGPEKEAFKILIDCPKIGPTLAMNILLQIQVESLFNLIYEENDSALSKINGIGPKSAKNLVSFLKEPVSKFLKSNKLNFTNKSEPSSSSHLFEIKEALISLGYSSIEINSVTKELQSNQELTSFEQKLRYALERMRKN